MYTSWLDTCLSYMWWICTNNLLSHQCTTDLPRTQEYVITVTWSSLYHTACPLFLVSLFSWNCLSFSCVTLASHHTASRETNPSMTPFSTRHTPNCRFSHVDTASVPFLGYLPQGECNDSSASSLLHCVWSVRFMCACWCNLRPFYSIVQLFNRIQFNCSSLCVCREWTDIVGHSVFDFYHRDDMELMKDIYTRGTVLRWRFVLFYEMHLMPFIGTCISMLTSLPLSLSLAPPVQWHVNGDRSAVNRIDLKYSTVTLYVSRQSGHHSLIRGPRNLSSSSASTVSLKDPSTSMYLKIVKIYPFALMMMTTPSWRRWRKTFIGSCLYRCHRRKITTTASPTFNRKDDVNLRHRYQRSLTIMTSTMTSMKNGPIKRLECWSEKYHHIEMTLTIRSRRQRHRNRPKRREHTIQLNGSSRHRHHHQTIYQHFLPTPVAVKIKVTTVPVLMAVDHRPIQKIHPLIQRFNRPCVTIVAMALPPVVRTVITVATRQPIKNLLHSDRYSRKKLLHSMTITSFSRRISTS